MGLSKKLSLILTIQCEEASRLTSEGMERRLKIHERLALRMHSGICVSCRQFAKQLLFLRKALRESGRRESESLEEGPVLEPDFKERLKRLRG